MVGKNERTQVKQTL